MVVSILFTYTKPFTARKKAEVLLLCHPLKNVNGPNILNFQTKSITVVVGLLFSEL